MKKIQDVKVLEKVLRFFNAKFNYVVVAIEKSKDIEFMIIDELNRFLLAHKEKNKEKLTKTTRVSIASKMFL